MELTAAINALNEIPASSMVTLYTDSQYVQKGIEEWMPKWLVRNWRGTNGPVANRDLWEALLAVSKKHSITWHWLRGHAGNRFNNRVDQLVGKAINAFKTGADH
jgi:ribonuclease HI